LRLQLGVGRALQRLVRRSKSRLPLKSVLKGYFENGNRRKLARSEIYSQTDVCEKTLISLDFRITVRFLNKSSGDPFIGHSWLIARD
jgi:hypothetical protein